MFELSTFVHMTQEIRYNSHSRAHGLNRDMPARSNDAKDHAEGEYESEGDGHEEDVCPEAAVDRVIADGGAVGDFFWMASMGADGGRQKEEEDYGQGRCVWGGRERGSRRHGCGSV